MLVKIVKMVLFVRLLYNVFVHLGVNRRLVCYKPAWFIVSAGL
jgi:hypothetical protein